MFLLEEVHSFQMHQYISLEIFGPLIFTMSESNTSFNDFLSSSPC